MRQKSILSTDFLTFMLEFSGGF